MVGLKKQIRLENWGTTIGTNGDNVESITVKYNFWANVKKTSGGRQFNNGQVQLDNQMVFTIRFRPDWKPDGTWKVIYRGKRWTVDNIEQDLENRFKWIITASGF